VFTAAAGVVLAATLALALHLVLVAARAQPLAMRGLPYAVVDASLGPPRWVLLALVAIAALQTAVLYALSRTLRRRGVSNAERAVLTLVALAMAAIALQSLALTSFDPYAYAGYAKLHGLAAAYTPPHARLPGTFAVVNTVWGSPLVPCYYGPLWIGVSTLVAGGATTVGAAIFAFRALEVAALVAVLALVAARTRDARLVALVAVNPGVYVLYVANAHNDLLAVAFLLAAVLAARRVPVVAAICVVAASLIKVPFAVFALYVFARLRARALRIAWAAVTIAAAAAVSFALGGAPYVRDLLARVHQTTSEAGLAFVTAETIKAGLAIVAVVALIAAVGRAVIWRAAGYAFTAFGSIVYPWYLIWALPYAALAPRALPAVLVPLPLVAALMEPAFPHVGFGQLAMLAILIVAAYEMLRRAPLRIERARYSVRPGP